MAGKGQPKTGGRKKGAVNKLTADVKAMILAALDEVGGTKYLVEQSKSNPTAFLTLVGKVLPMTVNASVASMTHEEWLKTLE